MEITKGQKRLLMLLGLVVSFAVFDFFTNRDKYLSFYGEKETTVKTVQQKKNVRKDTMQTAGQKEYVKSWGRDPFASTEQPKVINVKDKPVIKTRPLQLSAISYMGNNSVALINESIVKVGDKINGYVISAIEQKRVILTKDSERVVLTLQN